MGNIIITRKDDVLQTIAERPVAAVLSIEHPGAIAEGKGAPRLCDMPQEILCFWDSETPVKDGPDMAQVERAIGFSLAFLTQGDVLIHCHAGKSRSAAIALGVLAFQNPQKKECELVDMLLAIRPEAAPNLLVVDLVDKLARREGRLTRAVLENPVICAQRAAAEESRKKLLERRPELAKQLFPEKFPKP